MLRTKEGKTVEQMLKEFRSIEKKDPMNTNFTFEVTGEGSKSIGFENLTVKVECNVIWIRIIGKGGEIEIPNYGYVNTLRGYVEDGIELMLFKSKVY